MAQLDIPFDSVDAFLLKRGFAVEHEAEGSAGEQFLLLHGNFHQQLQAAKRQSRPLKGIFGGYNEPALQRAHEALVAARAGNRHLLGLSRLLTQLHLFELPDLQTQAKSARRLHDTITMQLSKSKVLVPNTVQGVAAALEPAAHFLLPNSEPMDRSLKSSGGGLGHMPAWLLKLLITGASSDAEVAGRGGSCLAPPSLPSLEELQDRAGAAAAGLLRDALTSSLLADSVEALKLYASFAAAVRAAGKEFSSLILPEASLCAGGVAGEGKPGMLAGQQGQWKKSTWLCSHWKQVEEWEAAWQTLCQRDEQHSAVLASASAAAASSSSTDTAAAMTPWEEVQQLHIQVSHVHSFFQERLAREQTAAAVAAASAAGGTAAAGVSSSSSSALSRSNILADTAPVVRSKLTDMSFLTHACKALSQLKAALSARPLQSAFLCSLPSSDRHSSTAYWKDELGRGEKALLSCQQLLERLQAQKAAAEAAEAAAAGMVLAASERAKTLLEVTEEELTALLKRPVRLSLQEG